MTFTAKIDKDIMRKSSYVVSIAGTELRDCIKFSSTSRKANKVDLPDRSVAPGPDVDSGEFDITFSSNATVSLALLDTLYVATSSGNIPTLPLAGMIPVTVTQISNSGTKARTITFLNCFIIERTEPDFDMNAVDQNTEVTYKFAYDECSVL